MQGEAKNGRRKAIRIYRKHRVRNCFLHRNRRFLRLITGRSTENGNQSAIHCRKLCRSKQDGWRVSLGKCGIVMPGLQKRTRRLYVVGMGLEKRRPALSSCRWMGRRNGTQSIQHKAAKEYDLSRIALSAVHTRPGSGFEPIQRS